MHTTMTLSKPKASRLIKRLRKDPVFFCQHILGIKPWEKQIEVLNALRDNDYVAVRSGHGTGKSFIAASSALWFLYSYYPAKVITTAPTWNQVRSILWHEIKRQHANAKLPLGGTVLQERIKLSPGAFAVGLSTDEPERFQGYHAENILVILDEAPGVRPEIWEAAETLLTSRFARMLAIGNPTKASGNFYKCFSPASSWAKVHISCLNSPNLSGESKHYPSLVTGKWIEQKKKLWGEKSPLYQARVLGNFPEDAEGLLIPKTALEKSHHKVSEKTEGILRLGVDVARSGEDESVFVLRDNLGVRQIISRQGLNTMEVTGIVVSLIKEHKLSCENVFVDDTGIGAGVTDRLHEQGFPITPVILGSSSRDSTYFYNSRAEVFWKLRESILNKKQQFCIGEDKQLLKDLLEINYTFSSSGAIKIEKKEYIKGRLGGSPDRADALALTFADSNITSEPSLTVI